MSKIEVIPTEPFAEELAVLTANPTTAFLFCVQTARPVNLDATERMTGVVTEVHTAPARQENGDHAVKFFATGADMAVLQQQLRAAQNPVRVFYMVRGDDGQFVRKSREALRM